MRIQRLSAVVANQIAAGEVIERPASVVKELLENATDAGATVISIEIGFGGLNQIKISDNGHGIAAEDLQLAITAHATSKIVQLNDLYQITTMGFRGEALASIASVSRLAIYSKPASQDHGMMIAVNESGVTSQPHARTQGTTIDVRDLFYNAPVRKSFLKTERQEYQAIELVIKQFALSAMTVAISLKHNGKETLRLPATHDERTRLQRIKKLFGQAFLADAVYINEVHEHLSIQGWITQSNYQRSQRDRQWIYLNQRLIKDKLMHQAIGQSYQELLHPGRHAACVLYVSIAPDQVDVNVHPTKHEVRFREPRLVHTMMVSILTKNIQPPAPAEPPTPIPQTNEPSNTFGTAPISPSADMPWIPINAQFVILKSAHAESYLLDLQRAHQYYLATLICDTTQPLPCRSLLVPIRVEIARSAFTTFERYQTELQDLGIQFDFMNEVSLLIRTIPLCLPLLDLEQFFVSIQQAYCDKKTLIERAIACQSFDVYNMRPVEIETLWAYCSQHWSELQQRNVGMLLDAEQCRKITRETRTHDNNTLVLSDGPDGLG